MSASPATRRLLSDVPRRLMTICIGVPILWMIWSFPMTRHVFFQGAHVVMGWEWTQLSKIEQQNQRPGFITYIFLFTSLALANIPEDSVFLLFLILSVACFPLLSGSISQSTVLASTAGFLLVTTSNRAWLTVSNNFQDTVNVLLTVWNADTGALVAGRLGSWLGTHWPRPNWLRTVSPAKSVEGLCGGLLGGTLTYWSLPFFWSLVGHYNLVPLPMSTQVVGWSTTFTISTNSIQGMIQTTAQANATERILTGVILSMAAILGDLWESSMKRAFGVKDSGKLLPGHGGVLDRFDSSLIAVMVYLHLLKMA